MKCLLNVWLGVLAYCSFVRSQLTDPGVSRVTWHLGAVCSPYQLEVSRIGNVCNRRVIDEVHDHAENVRLERYHHELVEDYLNEANLGRLCYGEGLTVYKLHDACDCMAKVCDRYSPKDVDFCSNIVLSPFGPSLNISTNYGHQNRLSPWLISGAQPASLARWMTLISAAASSTFIILKHSSIVCN